MVNALPMAPLSVQGPRGFTTAVIVSRASKDSRILQQFDFYRTRFITSIGNCSTGNWNEF